MPTAILFFMYVQQNIREDGEKIPLIEARCVYKAFGLNQVLRGVDLAFYEGEITVIMGPSGSGKSTLLYCLAGIIDTDKGDIVYNGRTVASFGRDAVTALRRSDFGFIFQFGELVPELPVRENVALPLLLRGEKKQDAYIIAMRWIDAVGIKELALSYPHVLSGGEVQRVAIARAMGINPRIIFADEPTGSLDSVNSKNVMELFVRVAKQYNKAVVIVTHSKEVASYADRVITLKDGVVESESLTS